MTAFFEKFKKFLFTRLLPTQARYWRQPWYKHDVQIARTQDFGGIRGLNTKGYLLERAYFFKFDLLGQTHHVRVGRDAWEKRKNGDHITIEFRYSRINDGTTQVRLPPIPDRLRTDFYPNRSN